MRQTHSSPKRFKALVVLLGLAMVIAACGGDGEAVDDTTTTAVDRGATTTTTGETPTTQGETDTTAGEPSGDPIVLGSYAGSTGVLAPFGSFEEEGWVIAEKHLNEDGGILGRPVEIVFNDTASEADQANTIMEEYVGDDRIVGVMGPTSSGNAFASHPLAVEAGLPVVAISNNAPGVVEQGEYVHRISVPEGRLLPALVNIVVKDLGIERAAILHAQDDPFSQGGFEAFRSALEDLGVEITNEVAYTSSTPDLGPQVRQLADGDPDAVFVAAFGEDAGSFLRQARQGGLTVPIVGNASFNSPAQLEIAGDAAAGLIIGSQWWLEDPDPLNQRFVEDYRAEFGRDPGNFSAMAYNGAVLIKQAIEAVGTADRESLQIGLLGLDGYDILGAPIILEGRDSSADEPIVLMVEEGNTTQFVAYDPSVFGE